MATALFDEVVLVTYVYLGPAADRFVARQIRNHLDIEPRELQEGDLPSLIEWIRLAMGFLTEDQRQVDEYIAKLDKLAVTPSKKRKGTASHASAA